MFQQTNIHQYELQRINKLLHARGYDNIIIDTTTITETGTDDKSTK